jgi:hypothetical protein
MKTPYALRTACTATGNVRFLERAALSPRHSCDDPLSRAAGNNGPDWSTLGADIVWCKCMPLRSAPRQLTSPSGRPSDLTLCVCGLGQL